MTTRNNDNVFVSDIAGQGVKSHSGSARELVVVVRNWLASYNEGLASGSIMAEEYDQFQYELPALCQETRLVRNELTFADYVRLVYAWLEDKESV